MADTSAAARHADLTAAEELLQELNRRLDGEVTWEVKRQLVELLVDYLLVDTVGEVSTSLPISRLLT